MSGWTLSSGFCQVSGKGFEGLLWERQGDRVERFSVGEGQFSFAERDIIQSDVSDLHRPQAQGIGQEDDSIGSDIGGRGQRQGGKEGLHFLRAQELGRLLFSEAPGSHEQRSQVFLHHPALPMQVPQESPKTIPIEVACSPRDLLLCQKVIELFNLQLRQGNAMFFKVVIERGQNAFHQSEVIGRNPVGLLAEIGIKGIGQIDQLSWGGQSSRDFAVAVKETGERDERTGGLFETAYVTERLQGVKSEHLFPGHFLACYEAKEVDQEEGIPGDGAMDSIGL
jgi:hypothetical protein